MGWDSNPRWA